MSTTDRAIRRLLGVDPLIVDAALAVALLLAALEIGRQYHPDMWRRSDITADLLSALIILPLAIRRRRPIAVQLIACAAFTTYLAWDYQPTVAFWAPVLGLYTVASTRPPAVAAIVAVISATVIGYSAIQDHVFKFDIVLGQGILVTGIAWAFGNNTRRLAERNARLAALGEQLRQEQDEREHRAVIEERLRITRELHDVAAHHMAVISVQAGLARYVFASDPMTARTALDTIAITAREALDEMRRILSVLRTSRFDGEPERDDSAPGLDRLERLVERVRRAGVPVELVITGTRRQLTEGQDQCAYRVVQESLTNVIKHAGPASVTVALRYGETDLIASVTDDGRSSASTAEEDPSGHGLMGMRERARIYGGTLIAGRRDDGGFEVVLSLPTGRHCGGAGSA